MHKGKKKNLTFSQRIGKKPIKTKLQIDSMDDDLRNSLLNIFYLRFIHLINIKRNNRKDYYLIQFSRKIWSDFFKTPIDNLTNDVSPIYRGIREWFLKCEWHEVYSFIQFIANLEFPFFSDEYKKECNIILERECSGYRFVGNLITPITNESEINEIEEAIDRSKEFKLTGVTKHIEDSLSKLSDRKNPDYRNSIKESISAVESICKIISGDDKATLGNALKSIEKKGKITIHKALKDGFEKIYGYTSDEEGIRHAMLDEAKIYFEDAKYMLVSCSAFINYLIEKALKSRIF